MGLKMLPHGAVLMGFRGRVAEAVPAKVRRDLLLHGSAVESCTVESCRITVHLPRERLFYGAENEN